MSNGNGFWAQQGTALLSVFLLLLLGLSDINKQREREREREQRAVTQTREREGLREDRGQYNRPSSSCCWPLVSSVSGGEHTTSTSKPKPRSACPSPLPPPWGSVRSPPSQPTPPSRRPTADRLIDRSIDLLQPCLGEAAAIARASDMKVQGNNGGGGGDPGEGEKKSSINPELWHACAGPLVTLPPVGSLVVYFPQGHSEQVAASMQKHVDAPVPNYPNLPSKLICLLHSVTLHADAETDEVYAQMTLQPVNTYDKEALLASDLSLKSNRPQADFFCKTLTASDTSTHGGFSVPRRAAEKIFPPLDFTLQPPAQELQARDLHDNLWTFRHIYRGQPKRHLLTTGWSLFVSGKRLFAGDSVLFIRDEKSQLLLGIRRANRQPTNLSSSVLSSDSMHIGILAAAAHAAANHSPFTVFYNPRASPSEFVIPLVKYNKAVYSNQISLGMRFRMMFETEESGTRRYMGTITGISDLDAVRWKNSQWRNLQVGWDESAVGERRNRVSVWEIEPVAAPFFIYPPPFFRSKRPRQLGMPDDESTDIENLFKRAMPWLGDEICLKDSQSQNAVMPGLSLVQWMNMQQNASLANTSTQPDYLQSIAGSASQNPGMTDLTRQMGLQAQVLQQNNIQCNGQRLPQQIQQLDQVSKVPLSQLDSIARPQQQLQDVTLQKRQQLVNHMNPLNQTQNQLTQSQMLTPSSTPQQQIQPPPLIPNLQPPQPSIPQNQILQMPQQQQLLLQHQQLQQQQQLQRQQSQMQAQIPQQVNQQLDLSEQQVQLQLLQKLQQQQQSLLMQQPQEAQDQPKKVVESSQHVSNSNLLPQQHSITQQIVNNISMGMQFSQSLQHQAVLKSHKQQVASTEINGTMFPSAPMNLIMAPGTCVPTSGGIQSASITSGLPSCSIPPVAIIGHPHSQTPMNKSYHAVVASERSNPTMPIWTTGNFDVVAANPSVAKELQKPEKHVKPSVFVSKAQDPGVVASQAYLGSTAQMDQLDSSSATSVCLSQNEGQLPPTFPPSPFNQTMMFRDAVTVDEVQAADPRNNVLFGVNIDSPLGIPLTTDPLLIKGIDSGKDYQNNVSSGNVLANYSTSKEAQQEISSSIVSQSFGVPDAAFNSIDSTINDSRLLNKWAPTPQLQRMRTYTKVYKRGAVGRSIDISRYSGYDELKQDLARMFSIEGQLEDRQRIGWKLVYVDHENDVLLVGDDPWEEFVSCVRCIRILSPQEVQQMSLDGDLGANVVTNQACSSSDGGNAWRGQCDQNSGNPSAGTYDHF